MANRVGLPKSVQLISNSYKWVTFSLFKKDLKEFSSMEQLFNESTLIFFKYLLLIMD